MENPGWSTGICDCCVDCPFCCLATFCTPVAFGYDVALVSGAPHPCRIQHCGMPYLQFMYLCAIQQYSVTSPQYLGVMSMWVCFTQVSLVKNMLVAVGTKRGIYVNDLPPCCVCCDEPFCLSFWCMPCMLTRIKHEVETHKIKCTYDDSRMVFKMVNSMFDVTRNI